TYVVVVDPRRTITARSADLHLQPRPATDGALALGLMHVIFRDNLHDAEWLNAHSVGWEELRVRVAAYPPERVAAITGIDAVIIESLARRFAAESPSMIKFSDGVQRHENGGQTIRAILCLPALTGQYGVPGGGIFYSQSGHIVWNSEAVGKASYCPPTPRIVNMNRLGAALTGEVSDPPIKSLYVFAANPVTSTPNAGLIVEGLLRDDLFTVVHEQFMTDTARYADIVLPATTQLEQVDLMKPYGHQHLQFNHQAIAPVGESRSNWTVMQSLAMSMGFDDPWLQQSSPEIIEEVLHATASTNPLLDGVTLERLQAEGTVPYAMPADKRVPFADGVFPTPSGRIELRCDEMCRFGVDPLPDYIPPVEFDPRRMLSDQLVLISGAAHHFVSSSLANQPSLRAKEGPAEIFLHRQDAARLGVDDQAMVTISNHRGSCDLVARISDDIQPGVAIAPKGHWAQHMNGQRGVNWVTSDRLADLGNQSTFHSTLISVRPLQMPPAIEISEPVAVPAD
ncbi:MAG: molybdopterin-dependent oxidoreductase, partial [Thermomicrobiales bacterium]